MSDARRRLEMMAMLGAMLKRPSLETMKSLLVEEVTKMVTGSYERVSLAAGLLDRDKYPDALLELRCIFFATARVTLDELEAGMAPAGQGGEA